jgi:hypothetical protein
MPYKDPKRDVSRRRRWLRTRPEYEMFAGARERARRLGLPCTITSADIVIPKLCPVLKIRLKKGVGRFTDSSPTLDRIRPKLGYVKGNIRVISFRANRIKMNANAKELWLVAMDARRLGL